ncbi:bifunctional diaminohydroxyphosphoribosylaminopyrimidine deaminase/5-amino-6-(5-phosphoribosylamino)uracil reductase RibD [Haloferula rosea]|uniref:bifunctional diaminohydroxyphosphoribosylaminopyrimidine deaminase/5-amino-6-(5-phosphoribosylamino)uracil reductase RibD n=1 Tax=Haloferula rosea TaxID=490093 RepID=UPI001F0098B0|nr:bifunctional diaminohydroxyphosphoribosylaminopyrimidine deaminase/5-amino-6-(5-phosphoribosylamino)uracil reductase RibD [Haloferula rosea]
MNLHFVGVEEDEQWMRRALEEAARGIGRTAPNPAVGCVIVRDGVELGAGWHRRAGMPHAEREAMADVIGRHGGEVLRGATAYVTLEPCSTRGRTPACTEGLIEHGIARVVYAVADPNPAHAGAADGILRDAGIEVRAGVLADEGLRLLRGFDKVQRTGLPWMIWKTAMSLDGRLTRPPGEGMWLTGTSSRAEVQRLRAEVDGIVTSGETVRRDNPRLDLRDPQWLEGREQPWRVVISRQGRALPEDAPLFTDAHADRTRVWKGDDVRGMLRRMVDELGVHTVLLECGGNLAGVCMDDGLIDEVVVFAAPMLCGGPVSALGGEGVADGVKLSEIQFARFDDDVMMRGVVEHASLTASAH